MNYDSILRYIGEFGYYQKRATFLLCLIGIQIGIHGTNIVFQTYKPNFRCAVPGLLNDTYEIQDANHERLVNAFIPFDKDTNHLSECKAYSFADSTNNSWIPSSNGTTDCDRWVYDTKTFGSSMAIEFDFVCGREMYKAHINMMIMLGLLVGSLFGGSIADFFGRKKVMVVSLLFQTVCSIFLAFAKSIPLIIAIRFFISVAGVTGFLTVFVLLAELVGASYRTLATMSIMFGWCAGLFTLLLVEYFIREWRTALLVQTVPFVVFVVYWWVLPESPRWLLNRGRLGEAEKIIRKMAKVNKVELPQEMEPVAAIQNGESDGAEQKKGVKNEAKFWHMCYRPVLVIRIVILAFSWSTISMVYYGLVLGVGDLIEGDIYVNYALQSAMEVVGNAVCLALMGRVGRKKIFCTSMILAGAACLSISIMIIAEADIHWLSATLFSLGKLGITLAFSLIYIVTAELLPTVVRNSGLGFCSFVGRIAGVASPYIATASLLLPGSFGKALPVLLFGALSLMSGMSSLMLPETKNRKLPETIDEANNFSKLKIHKKHSTILDDNDI